MNFDETLRAATHEESRPAQLDGKIELVPVLGHGTHMSEVRYRVRSGGVGRVWSTFGEG